MKNVDEKGCIFKEKNLKELKKYRLIRYTKIYKKLNFYREKMENSNELNILKNKIAKNNLYIPVVDMDGKLVFTYEKMKTVLNKYLQYLKGDNLALPEMDKIIEKLENKMLLETNKSIKTSHI